MVATVSKRRRDFFFTGTSAPDLSIFKPVHFDLPLEADHQGEDLSHYHDGSLWWRYEKWHRALLLAPRLDSDFIKERDEVERSMVLEITAQRGRQLAQTRSQLRDNLLKWDETWIAKAAPEKWSIRSISSFSRYWQRRNRLDGIEY